MNNWFRLAPVGDSALLVELGDEIDPIVNRRVHALAGAIAQARLAALVEIIPTYRSLLVRYDPEQVDYSKLAKQVDELGSVIRTAALADGRLVEVPVCYGGERGPDLDWVATHCGLAPERVVSLHSQTDYLVYMMGFIPGFPYMGQLDAALEVPRLESPRQRVAGGSVGLAGRQTGIYPFDSPGGWQIIGWTALQLFDPERGDPFLFLPGDRVRFVPVAGCKP